LEYFLIKQNRIARHGYLGFANLNVATVT